MADKMGTFGYILAGFVLLIILKMYWEMDDFGLKCIISDVDGNKYCVRERPKLQLAADLLATVTMKLKKLVAHLEKTQPKDPRTERLVANFDPKKIIEILPTSSFTAYSENKGQKLAFCTTTTKRGSKLIDENTLTFVGIHELGHIATKSYGHGEEFWHNFKFLLQNAVQKGLYTPVDYKKQPISYCGMSINDNPYYDL